MPVVLFFRPKESATDCPTVEGAIRIHLVCCALGRLSPVLTNGGVLVKRSDEPTIGQTSGGRGGITISRRPNR